MNYNKIFVTFFGVGDIKKAPGTFGSLAGLLFWCFITAGFDDSFLCHIFWLSFVAITTFYACNAIAKYGKQVGEIDHKSVVIDEVVGIVIALQIVYFCGFYQQQKIVALFLSFAFFRLFDITKPSIIGWCDKNLKTGFGVMLDDILAGIFAGIATSVIMFFAFMTFDKDFIDFLLNIVTSIATVIACFSALFYAKKQTEIAQKQRNDGLYDKRFAVYEQFNMFSRKIILEKGWSDTKGLTDILYNKVMPHKFLFDVEIKSLIDEVDEKYRKIGCFRSEGETIDGLDKQNKEYESLINFFKDLPKKLEKEFEPYLELEKPTNKPKKP